MGRRHEQTFLQTAYTDGQQTHEKMCNITHHQGNANQNHNEISPNTCQDGENQEHKKQVSVDKNVKKKEPYCIVGMSATGTATVENSMEFLQRLKIRTIIWGCLGGSVG